MRKISDEEKKRRGTHRRLADKRSWAGRAQRARQFRSDAEVSPEQQTLLAAMPADLEGEAKDCYEQCVRTAPWLRPIDRGGLVVYACAVATHSMAGRELDRCMRDPQFVDPKSEASQAGKIYLRILGRQASVIAQWSDLLAFNPRARARIGVVVDRAPPGKPDQSGPWKLLQILPGGKGDSPDASA
jgi:hypothetical protein